MFRLLEKSSENNNKIGLFSTISLGVGTMIGGGIFALLGLAIKYGGAGTEVSFLIAGIVALFTSYSYSKLSLHYRKRGGTITFFKEIIKNQYVVSSLGVLLVFNYIIMVSIYSYAFGTYGATFFPNANPFFIKHLLISVGIIIPALVNFLPTKGVGKTELALVFIQLAVFLFFIIMGTSEIEPARLSIQQWPNVMLVIGAGMLIFTVFEGFELISNAAPDVKDPEKTLPKAFFIAIILVIALYVCIAIITVGGLPLSKISSVQNFVLAEAARPSLGNFGFKLMSATAVIGSLGAASGSIFGVIRITDYLYQTDHGIAGDTINKKLSLRVIIGVVILALLIANCVLLESIATMASSGFLLIYTCINFCNFKIAKENNSSRGLSLLAGTLTFLSLAVLIYHSSTSSPKHLLSICIFFIVAAVGGYFLYLLRRKQKV